MNTMYYYSIADKLSNVLIAHDPFGNCASKAPMAHKVAFLVLKGAKDWSYTGCVWLAAFGYETL